MNAAHIQELINASSQGIEDTERYGKLLGPTLYRMRMAINAARMSGTGAAATAPAPNRPSGAPEKMRADTTDAPASAIITESEFKAIVCSQASTKTKLLSTYSIWIRHGRH